MKRSVRTWTVIEKALFLLPLLASLGAAVVWWRQKTEPIVVALPPKLNLLNLTFSPDSKKLLVAGEKGFAPLYEVETQHKVWDLELPLRLSLFCPPSFSPDGTRMAALCSGQVVIWNANTGRIVAASPPASYSDELSGFLYFSGDGRKIIGNGTPPAIFDTQTGAVVRNWGEGSKKKSDDLSMHLNPAQDLVELFEPHSKMLVVRDVDSNRELFRSQADDGLQVGWRSNILGFLKNHRLILWDGTKNELLRVPVSRNVQTFQFFSQSSQIAIAQIDWGLRRGIHIAKSGNLVVWDYQRGAQIWSHPMRGRFSPQISPDGQWVAVVDKFEASSGEEELWVFDAKGKTVRHDRVGFDTFLRWSPDSKLLALAETAKVKIFRFG